MFLWCWFFLCVKHTVKFSLRLIGSAMFGATFNLVTSVGVP